MVDKGTLPFAETAASPDALGGIIAAALTPINARHKIDIGRLAEHIRRLRQEGCRYVVLFGSTGEGPSFSVRQKRQALAELARAGVPMDRLIPAAMSSAAEDTAAMIASGAEFGCRAALVLPPYYFGAAAAGIAAYFADFHALLGGRSPIDLLLYHIPAMSRVGFDPGLVAGLVEQFDGRIVGIKDSTGDAAHTLMLARRFPELRIFTGDDRVLPGLLAAGGAGLIGGLPNLFAADLCRLFADPAGPEAPARLAQAAARIAAVEAAGGLVAPKALRAERERDPAWLLPRPPRLPREPGAIAALQQALGHELPVPDGSG